MKVSRKALRTAATAAAALLLQGCGQRFALVQGDIFLVNEDPVRGFIRDERALERSPGLYLGLAVTGTYRWDEIAKWPAAKVVLYLDARLDERVLGAAPPVRPPQMNPLGTAPLRTTFSEAIGAVPALGPKGQEITWFIFPVQYPDRSPARQAFLTYGFLCFVDRWPRPGHTLKGYGVKTVAFGENGLRREW